MEDEILQSNNENDEEKQENIPQTNIPQTPHTLWKALGESTLLQQLDKKLRLQRYYNN